MIQKKLKPKFCKQCGKEFRQNNSLHVVCSSPCYFKWTSKKEVDKRVKEMRKEVRKKSSYEEVLEIAINTIVRLIDKGHPCMTSGSTKCVFHAGHFISVGSNATLRYNLLNIYAQSEQDNYHKGGKGSNYGIRLMEVFGKDVRDEIESLPGKYKSLNLSKEQLGEFILEAKQIIKELKAADKIFTTEERIILRREYNERIGIYK